MNKIALGVAALAALAAGAQASFFDVFAKANSSTGGVGAATVFLNSGDAFTVSVSTTDLWSAGALPRWSNADGLIVDLYATGSDDSGEAAGTHIGAPFGPHTQGSLTTAFGTLVGQIGAGSYFVVGTSYSGTANASGTLKLYYWDSNYEDNADKVTADVNVVPEPASIGLLGLGLVGLLRRRR